MKSKLQHERNISASRKSHARKDNRSNFATSTDICVAKPQSKPRERKAREKSVARPGDSNRFKEKPSSGMSRKEEDLKRQVVFQKDFEHILKQEINVLTEQLRNKNAALQTANRSIGSLKKELAEAGLRLTLQTQEGTRAKLQAEEDKRQIVAQLQESRAMVQSLQDSVGRLKGQDRSGQVKRLATAKAAAQERALRLGQQLKELKERLQQKGKAEFQLREDIIQLREEVSFKTDNLQSNLNQLRELKSQNQDLLERVKAESVLQQQLLSKTQHLQKIEEKNQTLLKQNDALSKLSLKFNKLKEENQVLINKSKKEAEQFEQKQQETAREVEDLKKKLQKANQLKDMLKFQAQQAKDDAAKAQTQRVKKVAALQQKLVASQLTVSELGQCRQLAVRLQEQLLEKDQKCTSLTEAYDQLKQSSSQMRRINNQQKSMLQNRLLQHQQQLTRLKVEYQKLQETLSLRQSEMEQEEQRSRERQTVLGERLQASEQERNKLVVKSDALESELGKMRSGWKGLCAELQLKQDLVRRLMSEAAAVSDQYSLARQQLQSLRGECQQLKETKQNLGKQLQSERRRKQLLEGEIASLRQAVSSMAVRGRRLGQEPVVQILVRSYQGPVERIKDQEFERVGFGAEQQQQGSENAFPQLRVSLELPYFLRVPSLEAQTLQGLTKRQLSFGIVLFRELREVEPYRETDTFFICVSKEIELNDLDQLRHKTILIRQPFAFEPFQTSKELKEYCRENFGAMEWRPQQLEARALSYKDKPSIRRLPSSESISDQEKQPIEERIGEEESPVPLLLVADGPTLLILPKSCEPPVEEEQLSHPAEDQGMRLRTELEEPSDLEEREEMHPKSPESKVEPMARQSSTSAQLGAFEQSLMAGFGELVNSAEHREIASPSRDYEDELFESYHTEHREALDRSIEIEEGDKQFTSIRDQVKAIIADAQPFIGEDSQVLSYSRDEVKPLAGRNDSITLSFADHGDDSVAFSAGEQKPSGSGEELSSVEEEDSQANSPTKHEPNEEDFLINSGELPEFKRADNINWEEEEGFHQIVWLNEASLRIHQAEGDCFSSYVALACLLQRCPQKLSGYLIHEDIELLLQAQGLRELTEAVGRENVLFRFVLSAKQRYPELEQSPEAMEGLAGQFFQTVEWCDDCVRMGSVEISNCEIGVVLRLVPQL